MALFHDPGEWAKGVAGSRPKLFAICTGHVLIGFAGMLAVQDTELEHAFTFGIAVFGVLFPCMYLYALWRVLSQDANR